MEDKQAKGEEANCQLAQTHYNIQLKGLGISLVDFKPKELAFISMSCLAIDYSTFFMQKGVVEKSFTDLELVLRNF